MIFLIRYFVKVSVEIKDGETEFGYYGSHLKMAGQLSRCGGQSSVNQDFSAGGFFQFDQFYKKTRQCQGLYQPEAALAIIYKRDQLASENKAKKSWAGLTRSRRGWFG
jgi:hypothetical protein